MEKPLSISLACSALGRRIALALLPPLVARLMRLWFGTCRLEVRDAQEFYGRLERGDQMIASFWHYSFFYLFYYLRGRHAATMVSASTDGEYIARLALCFGHQPVRGSSHRRGFRALREMLAALARGLNAGIVADGSQGPARRAQAGCILMASHSGCPIFPVAWAASRAIIFHSWDRTVLPLPFSRIVLYHGPPIPVPPELSAAETEAWRQHLEDELNRLYHAAWQALGKGPHDGNRARRRHAEAGDRQHNQPSGQQTLHI